MDDIDKVIELLREKADFAEQVASVVYEMHACDRASAAEWWQKHFFAEGIKHALHEVCNLKQENKSVKVGSSPTR